MQETQLDVSVILVNWNTRDILRDCLKSVYEQVGFVKFEVIVVDNASTDGSYDMVRNLFPKIMLISNDTNIGYAAAVNQGMRVAKGRYFLILNSDTLICDRAIEKTTVYADDHPQAAVIGCQVYGKREIPQLTSFRFPSALNLFLSVFGLSRIFKKNRFFGRERMQHWLHDTERQVDVVAGVFMLVRREAVDEVGLMDEAYFFLYEETDWCYRFRQAGWKVLFWPGAKIIHVGGGGQSRKKVNLKIMVQTQKSALIFFKKHSSHIEYLLARFLMAIHCGLRCITWRFLTVCKKIIGKDATYEAERTWGFWLSFKYCVWGIELDTEVERK